MYAQPEASQLAPVVKNPPANAGDTRHVSFIPPEIPWRRAWQHTTVFLPGKFHGQRTLEGHKESDTTEAT